MVAAGLDRGDNCVDCLRITCDVTFRNKLITSIGASEMRAYSTAFMSLTSSNVTASNEPARRAYTVLRQGGPLGELSSSS
jgi:hypothetical protein